MNDVYVTRTNKTHLGVSTGITVGVFAIVSQLGMKLIVILLLVQYPVACALDLYADSALVATAWDSAGVTTGEVTGNMISPSHCRDQCQIIISGPACAPPSVCG